MGIISCTRIGVAAAILAVPAFVLAQGAPAQKPAPAGQKPAAPATSAPVAAPAQPSTSASQPAAEPYTYSPESRRDPFVSLISRGIEPSAGGKRTERLSGMSTAELMVKGVLLSRGSYIALVQGTDGKTFTAHVNDKLVDGTIRSITPQGLVIMQEVNDPLSLIKQKEVRKGLRASEDGKQ
jgi:Tfp pilus assembly protein PilP